MDFEEQANKGNQPVHDSDVCAAMPFCAAKTSNGISVQRFRGLMKSETDNDSQFAIIEREKENPHNLVTVLKNMNFKRLCKAFSGRAI
jgi:hypothetical protein